MDRLRAFHLSESITAISCIVGVVLSLIMYSIAQSWEQEHIKKELHRVATADTTAFELELSLAFELLENTVSFYNASNNVSEEEFKIFATKDIDRHPGLNAIFWAQKTPPTGETLNKNASTLITFISPHEKNKQLINLNLSSIPSLQDKLNRARDLDEMEISYGFGNTIVNYKPTLLTILPVYNKSKELNATRRERLMGYIIGELELDTIFGHALKNLETKSDLLNIQIYDHDHQLIYRRLNDTHQDTDLTSNLTFILSHKHQWTLEASPTQAFIDARKTWQPLIILSSLLLITFLLSSMFYIMARKQSSIENTVTQRTNELKQSENKLRTILNSTSNGILLISEQGIITLINPATEEMLGYHETELLNQHFSILLPLESQENHERYIEMFKKDPDNTRQSNLDAFGMHKDGRNIPVNISINELQYEDKIFFVCVLLDITERIQNDKMKSEFISTVSHELRTPLTSINGALKLIISQFEELPNQAKDLLTIASRNTERQLNLVNDLLDLQKITAGKMTFDIQEHTLSELVQSAIDSVRGITDNTSIKIDIDDNSSQAIIVGDKTHIIQVITNLLSNAIKFSKPDDTILITLEDQATMVRVAVKDNGPGIPIHFKNKIFNRFVQADSSDQRHTGGTGLGLAICKNLMEGMHGSIGYTSTPGNGSTFYILLPKVIKMSAAAV